MPDYNGGDNDNFVSKFDSQLSSDITGISPPEKELASQVKLYQCYPNPWYAGNQQLTIAFELPRATSLSVRIYDISGKLVRSLVRDEMRETGPHSQTWDGADDQDQAVGSGVYFYRLESDSFYQTKRMILMR